jgi:2-phospho-L-lactate guanylyltransferase
MTEHADWTVLVPLKRLAEAKSRLDLAAVQRQRVAVAMTRSMLIACRASTRVGRIVAVLQDPEDGDQFASLVEEIRIEAIPGLNPAIRRAEAALRGREMRGRVAVLPGDLPFVTSVDIDQALALAAGHRRSFVPDRQASGTILLAATEGTALDPHYGPDSAGRHLSTGARMLAVAVGSGLRHDVDVVTDLADFGTPGAIDARHAG